MSDQPELRIESRVVELGRPERVPGGPLNAPIVPASSFHAGGEFVYAREDSPTARALEAAIGGLEGGIAVVFSSGMAAANAVMDLVPAGGVVVVPDSAYTGVAVRLRELDEIGRIRLVVVDLENPAELDAALIGASLFWLESPTNPLMQVVDLANVIDAAHRAGSNVVVDSTFATPMCQRPIEHGADFVMHSVTKALAGHSDLTMGAIVSRSDDDAERIRSRRTLLGGTPSAFDCALALRGIRTLALRVERGEESAKIISARLAEHPRVSRVRYPGFGTMAAFELDGNAESAEAVCARVRLWTHATSLGGVESLIERRRRWPKESPVVPNDLIRISVGIEHVEDLWSDLAQALEF